MQCQDLRNNWKWPCSSLCLESLSQVRGLEKGTSRIQPNYFKTKQEQVKRDDVAWWLQPGQVGKRAGVREMGKASHLCIFTLQGIKTSGLLVIKVLVGPLREICFGPSFLPAEPREGPDA